MRVELYLGDALVPNIGFELYPSFGYNIFDKDI